MEKENQINLNKQIKKNDIKVKKENFDENYVFGEMPMLHFVLAVTNFSRKRYYNEHLKLNPICLICQQEIDGICHEPQDL